MKHFLSFVLAGLAATGYAIPFDNSTGAPATVIVNADGSGDYTSLGEASTAFNAVSGGINRTWTLLVDSDLDEPNPIAFGNNVAAGSKVIVKPNTGKTPTVTFTNTTAPRTSAIYGAWLIGANNGALNNGENNEDPTGANIFLSNDAYVIDGSNTENGTTRDLTIQNVETEQTGHIIRVVGSSHGTIIKNVNILQKRSTGAANGISFGGGRYAGFNGSDPDGNFRSNNCVIENCYIQAKSSPSGTGTVGIGINSSVAILYPTGTSSADITALYTLSPGLHFENFIFRNNDFDVKHRGIGMHFIINSTYENNRFSVRNTTSGGGSAAIIHLAQNTPDAPYDMTIRNNIIHTLETVNVAAAGGITGIDVGVGGGATARPTYHIYNNVVTGFAHTAAESEPATDQIVRGIQLATTNTNAEIHHNSINVDIPTNYKATAASIGKVAGLVIASNASGEIKKITNNLVRVNVGGTNSAAYRSGTGLATLGSGNNFVKNNGGYHSIIVTRYHATYADMAIHATDGVLYAVGGAQSVDPATLSPAWDTNPTAEWPLSFASVPAGLGKADVSTISTDIKGIARGTENVYPGAYAIATSNVADWSTY